MIYTEQALYIHDADENAGQRIVVIMKGAHGSGKTTLAKKIRQFFGAPELAHVEQAKCYYNRGVYRFNKIHYQMGIGYTMGAVEILMQKQEPVIIIDSTSLQLAHIRRYIRMANKAEYFYIFAEPDDWLDLTAEELLERSPHTDDIELIKKQQAVCEPWLHIKKFDNALLNTEGK